MQAATIYVNSDNMYKLYTNVFIIFTKSLIVLAWWATAGREFHSKAPE